MAVYEYISYKTYMKKLLSTSGKDRGARSKLAKFLNCQTGYISQVLRGNTDFSLEHAVKINEFLEHDEEEKHFFMLLVHYERAGSADLKKYYKKQIDLILRERSEIKSRINEDSALSKEDHAEYYSQWYYAAVHVIVSINKYQTKAKIKERLKLDQSSLNKVLSFLQKKQLIFEEKGVYKIGARRIHLSKDSPMIPKHHTNWRIESLKALERGEVNNLHYSSVITLSKSDAEKIKEVLLSSIERIEPILTLSPEEDIYSMNLDFFKL